MNQLFALLGSSPAKARDAIHADYVLVPLEPWVSGEQTANTGVMTLTGRAQMVQTRAGRQVPVLQSACFPLEGPGPILAGRTGKANLLIDQPTVSRLHAEFRAHGSGYSVVDRGSYNGTMVNNRVLEQGEVVPLQDGDVVVLGEAQLAFGSLEKLAELIKRPR
ncbi:MAG: FHA domain-containing protein [Deltaproteobacteria bacterium]